MLHYVVLNDVKSLYFVVFNTSEDISSFLSVIDFSNSTCIQNESESILSTFDKRTDSWSAVQYFQFYSYLSQQQNMMQDFIRTSTYRSAVLSNAFSDFRGKVVLDVGAGSGILSFFAIQGGAKRVYAVEASNMAAHCNALVQANKLAGRIVVVSGKIEEITLPEPVDVIISEPIGYMLYNERMLESYVHARKFLAPYLKQPTCHSSNNKSSKTDSTLDKSNITSEDGEDDQCLDSEHSGEDVDIESPSEHELNEKSSNCALIRPGIMFPTVANLYIVPFTDEALFAEQHAKANFWYQQNFHGMDLSALRNAALTEYFNQPIVDTFDVGICPAFPCVHKVDFRTITESQMAFIDVALHYQINTCTTIHGLAFWFDVGFLGSDREVWLSTSPTEPLTHWYQVRCLLGTPLFVQEGQTLNGRLVMQANSRQSYDVKIELIIPGSQTKISNNLDLKNPHFRYNGYPPAPPPGSHVRSPTDAYYTNLYQQQQQHQLDLQAQAIMASANPVRPTYPTTASIAQNTNPTLPPGYKLIQINNSDVNLNPYNAQPNNTIVNQNIQMVTDHPSMELSPQPVSNISILNHLPNAEINNNLVPVIRTPFSVNSNNSDVAQPQPTQAQQIYQYNPTLASFPAVGNPNFLISNAEHCTATTNGWRVGAFTAD